MKMKAKAQVTQIGIVLATAIVLSVVAGTYLYTKPITQKSGLKQQAEYVKSRLEEINRAIENVVLQGRGATQVVTVNLKDCTIMINSGDPYDAKNDDMRQRCNEGTKNQTDTCEPYKNAIEISCPTPVSIVACTGEWYTISEVFEAGGYGLAGKDPAGVIQAKCEGGYTTFRLWYRIISEDVGNINANKYLYKIEGTGAKTSGVATLRITNKGTDQVGNRITQYNIYVEIT